MLSDPRMQKVGRGKSATYLCAVCDQELNEVTVKNIDPFCSTACAHAYHGVEIAVPFKGQTVASTS